MTQAGRRSRSMVALGATAVLLVAACSSGSDGEADETTVATTAKAASEATAAPTTEPEPEPPGDTAPPPDTTEPDLEPPPLPALDEGQLLFFGAMPTKPDWVPSPA